MKKVFYMICLSVLALSAQSCDPMKDTYAILDEGSIDQSGVKEIELVLTSAEYNLLDKVAGAETIKENQTFATEDEAKQFIPTILSKKYPFLGEKAAVSVEYKIGVVLNQQSLAHTATTEEYTKAGLNFPNVQSNEQVQQLAKAIKDVAVQGDVMRLTYKWYPGRNPTIDSTQNIVYHLGNWHPGYTLNNADYTNMQQAYTNFTSRSVVETLLPVFIKNKFPYILKEGYMMPVLYTLRTNNVNSTATTILQYTNGSWRVYENGMMKFSFSKGQWVADNTIRYTIPTAEHRTIIAPLVENQAARESIAQYGNFDLRLFSHDDVIKYLGLFSKAKFPTAAVGQRYMLTYRTHNPSGTATMWLELKENGNYEVVPE